MKIVKMQYRGLGVLLTLLLHIVLPKRAIRIAAIAMLATFCVAGAVNAYVFEDDFESGGTGAWGFPYNDPGDYIGATTEQAYGGTYALKCAIDDVETGGQAWITMTPPAANKYYARVYYFFSNSFSPPNTVTLTKYAHSSWSNLIATTIRSDMTLFMWNSIAGEAYGYGSTPVISKNEWHSIEMMADVATGTARVWLDGTLIIDETGVNLGANPIDRISTGISWADPKLQASTLYIDDAVFDTQYIGLGGALAVNPTPLTVFEGEDVTASISGGTTPYSAGGYNSSIATVDITGTTMTVTGVSAGTTTITVTDADSTTVDVTVTVTEALAVTPTNVNLYLTAGSDTADVTVSGGQAGYTVTSGNSAVATVSISGSTVTITGAGAGTVTITITDALDNHVYVTAVVGDSITAGLGDCPAPPFAQAGISPNVMIMFDTSGSMSNDDDGDDNIQSPTRFEEARTAMLDFLAANKNIRFGLARLDGSPWDDSGNRAGGLVSHHNAIKGGRILVPTGFTGGFASSADYIIDYINTHMSTTVDDWRANGGARHWTNLAETLATIGRYYATVEDGSGTRSGKGPAGFDYYREGIEYDFYYNSNWYEAAKHDDYGNPIDTTSPLQHSCEQAFVIMFTDGEATMDNGWDLVNSYIGDYDGDNETFDCPRPDPEIIRPGISDPGNSQYGIPVNPTAIGAYPCDTRNDVDDGEGGQGRYLDDVAKFLYDNDMRSDIPGKQNVITYTIGFYIADQLLRDAADNGGGDYYTASSISDLSNALQAAMADILARVASGTSVSTITTTASSDDYLIRAKFLPGSSWKGYLERFTLPYVPDSADWEAGQNLKDRVAASGFTDRKIWTFLSAQNPKKQLFTSDDGAVKTRMGDIWDLTSDWDEVADTINYVRGDQTYDGDKYRDRQGWLLGDIIYSTPISIGAPRATLFGSDSDHPERVTYSAFRAANDSRKTMIYVGANDGMLHAFRALDDESADCAPGGSDEGSAECGGWEEWAFIPENLQGKLLKLTDEDCHQYFVDLTPAAADVYDGTKWLTILIGGNRLGGQEYFALDVTDPTDMNDAGHDTALWDVIPFNGKMSSTVPAIGKVRANNDSVDNWAAIVTSGYHEGFDPGEIAALDIATGNKLNIWKIGPIWDDDRNAQSKSAGSPYYTLSSPAVLDSDMDGYLDLIFAGDTEGTLWKYYYDYEDQGWKRVALFNATDSSGNPQPITARPSLAFSNGGKYLRIYFGTGKYMEESDKANSIQNAFYGLIEERQYPGNLNDGHFTGTAEIDKSDLGNLTSIVYDSDFYHTDNTAVRTDALANGWYFYLDHQAGNPAERVLSRALIAAKHVFFSSFAPNQDVCGFGGDARLYAVEYISGTVDDDKLPLENMTAGKRYAEIGYGIPSKPVYYLDPTTLETSGFVQTSDTDVPDPKFDVDDRSLRIRTWQTMW